jgi:uncharacterized membrane protein YhaH (DUF805 family)
MTFGEAISDGFSKYVTFSGRSSRSAYWWWYLFTVLVTAAAQALDLAFDSVAVLSGIAGLALFLPSLAVLVRRFHDAGHSGWWVLIMFVPIVGFVVWLIFALTPSKPPNEWGEGPDAPARASVA